MKSFFALAAVLLAAAEPGPTIRLELPERTPCASQELAGALRARLPGSLTIAGGSPRPGEVTLRLSRGEGDEWAVELQAPGERPLARRFAAADCLALAEATAAIAERYLRGIAWSLGPAALGPLPPPPPPPRWQAELALAGGLGVGGMTGPAPAAQLEIGARLEGWLFQAWAAYLGSGQLDLTSGPRPAYLFHHSGAVGVALGRRFRLGPGALRLALTPAAALLWAGSGAEAGSPDPLPRRQLAFAALPALGLQLGYGLTFLERLEVAVRLQARAHLGSATFSAEGYTARLATHVVDGEAMLTVGYLFF